MKALSNKIAEKLHQTRAAAWTIDDSIELAATIRAASADECQHALLDFTMGLLSASRNVLTLQLDAALIEDVIAERDGGTLQ
jgi:hypothetical protein